MIMGNKELLMKQIEQEREKLNNLLAGGIPIDDVLSQSRIVDQLIEQYMDCI
jgi:hypothetical protein